MALIIEDGTIVSGANSYASAITVTTYLQDRYGASNVFVASTTAVKEQYILQAMDLIEHRYIESWKGDRVSISQVLAWPRSGVHVDGVLISSTSIPSRLIAAVAELAKRLADGIDIYPDLPTEGDTKREKVGPIEVEYRDFSQNPLNPWLIVNDILRSLLQGSDQYNRG